MCQLVDTVHIVSLLLSTVHVQSSTVNRPQSTVKIASQPNQSYFIFPLSIQFHHRILYILFPCCCPRSTFNRPRSIVHSPLSKYLVVSQISHISFFRCHSCRFFPWRCLSTPCLAALLPNNTLSPPPPCVNLLIYSIGNIRKRYGQWHFVDRMKSFRQMLFCRAFLLRFRHQNLDSSLI
jgi:hypothetical protein